MTDLEIFEKMCYYDNNRQELVDNGWTQGEIKSESGNSDCFCDNCFYSRSKMADYILELKGEDKEEFIKRMEVQ